MADLKMRVKEFFEKGLGGASSIEEKKAELLSAYNEKIIELQKDMSFLEDEIDKVINHFIDAEEYVHEAEYESAERFAYDGAKVANDLARSSAKGMVADELEEFAEFVQDIYDGSYGKGAELLSEESFDW